MEATPFIVGHSACSLQIRRKKQEQTSSQRDSGIVSKVYFGPSASVSYRDNRISALYRSQEQMKKGEYVYRIGEVDRAFFTPVIFSTVLL